MLGADCDHAERAVPANMNKEILRFIQVQLEPSLYHAGSTSGARSQRPKQNFAKPYSVTCAFFKEVNGFAPPVT